MFNGCRLYQPCLTRIVSPSVPWSAQVLRSLSFQHSEPVTFDVTLVAIVDSGVGYVSMPVPSVRQPEPQPEL